MRRMVIAVEAADEATARRALERVTLELSRMGGVTRITELRGAAACADLATAAEFGYKACEKGLNIQAMPLALSNALTDASEGGGDKPPPGA